MPGGDRRVLRMRRSRAGERVVVRKCAHTLLCRESCLAGTGGYRRGASARRLRERGVEHVPPTDGGRSGRQSNEPTAHRFEPADAAVQRKRFTLSQSFRVTRKRRGAVAGTKRRRAVSRSRTLVGASTAA